VKQWHPDPPWWDLQKIALNMGEGLEETKQAEITCVSLGWVNNVDGRYYITLEGDHALSKAVENSTTVTPASIAKHRTESLTGIREHTRKKQSVTSETKLCNAVLPKKYGDRDMKYAIEDALDLLFRIRRIAKERGKTVEEILMEEME